MHLLSKVIFCLLLLPAIAGAQVFKCADSSGKVQFSDKPCAASQKSSEVRIYASPTAPATRMSAEAVAHEKTRQQRRQESDDSHQRIDDATARVQQIRSDNQDPRKCAEAREKMARMEQRDPMYKINIDYTMAQQRASLYCGN